VRQISYNSGMSGDPIGGPELGSSSRRSDGETSIIVKAARESPLIERQRKAWVFVTALDDIVNCLVQV